MIRGIDGGAGAITWHPHNRATIARRNPTPPLQLPKKLPAFEFWQVFAPSQPPTGCPDGWLVDISMAPKHLCLEAPVRPGHVRVATHNGSWMGGRGGEAQNRPKLEPWRVFHRGHYFGYLNLS